MNAPPEGFAAEVCAAAAPLIQEKARQLVRRRKFREDERQDVQQEFFKRLLERLPSIYAQRHNLKRVIKQILKQSISNQLRYRNAKRRDPARTQSLEIQGDSEACADLWLSQRELDARRGVEAADSVDLADRAMDIDEAVAELTEDQRRLCETLQVETMAEAARLLGIAPSTFQSHVRRVREIFVAKGLREYAAKARESDCVR